jgi:hypothetical protein
MQVSTQRVPLRQGTNIINFIAGSQNCVPKEQIGGSECDYYIIKGFCFVL